MSHFRVVMCPSFAGCGLLLLLLMWGAGSVRSFGQVPDEPKDTERAARFRELQQRVQAMKAYQSKEGVDVALELSEKPLLRYADTARLCEDAGVWAWGRTGRPAALVNLEKYKDFWFYYLVCLTDSRVYAVNPAGEHWTPRESALKWQQFPKAPVAAQTKAGRLRQMKLLVRRFEASEIHHNGNRYQLRLIPQPASRYSDPKTQLVDGALFFFTYGTNPELLAFVECQRQDSGEEAWHYALAPITYCSMSVTLDGKEAWSVPLFAPRSLFEEPYMGFEDRPDVGKK